MNLNKIRQKAEQNAKSRVCWVLCAKMQVLADLLFLSDRVSRQVLDSFRILFSRSSSKTCLCTLYLWKYRFVWKSNLVGSGIFSSNTYMQNEGAVFSKYDIQLQIPIHSMHTQIHYNLLLCSMVL